MKAVSKTFEAAFSFLMFKEHESIFERKKTRTICITELCRVQVFFALSFFVYSGYKNARSNCWLADI